MRRQLAFEDLPQVPCHSLPLLDRVVDHARGMAPAPLSGWTVLMIQHQFANQVPLPAALVALGARPADVHWLDVPYTAHPVAVDEVVRRGVPRRNMRVHELRLDQPYEPYQAERVTKVLAELRGEQVDRLLVLDDGAYTLGALARGAWRPPRLAMVEQTTRGHIKCELDAAVAREAARQPVVDVARSGPKVELESHVIAHTIRVALQARLDHGLGASSRVGCLVLGYGAIGATMAQVVRNSGIVPEDAIVVWDPRREAVIRGAADGFAIWDRTQPARFGLVIGTTGQTSFSVADVRHLAERSWLVSCSSGSVEFDREQFVERALAAGQVVAPRDLTDIHADIELALDGRRVTICNGGFPINLNGDLCVAPNEYIQTTTALMCTAAVQATCEERRGWLPVDRERQDLIANGYREFLAEHGLQHPFADPAQ